jgi:hypothetical protein
MLLPFGAFKGHDLSDPAIPDSYMRWLASRGRYDSKINRFETAWKVPVDVWMAARKEMERRGYVHIGERFERSYHDMSAFVLPLL